MHCVCSTYSIYEYEEESLYQAGVAQITLYQTFCTTYYCSSSSLAQQSFLLWFMIICTTYSKAKQKKVCSHHQSRQSKKIIILKREYVSRDQHIIFLSLVEKSLSFWRKRRKNRFRDKRGRMNKRGLFWLKHHICKTGFSSKEKK